jgi:hypothetical protein
MQYSKQSDNSSYDKNIMTLAKKMTKTATSAQASVLISREKNITMSKEVAL